MDARQIFLRVKNAEVYTLSRVICRARQKSARTLTSDPVYSSS